MRGVLGRIHRARVVALATFAQGGPRIAQTLQSLIASDVTVLEVTLRSKWALPAIESAASSSLTVGAGTVLSVDHVRRAVDAGAEYIVSPGFDPAILAECRRLGVACIPGVATATEVQRALAEGAEMLKLFPASVVGGPRLLTALNGPFPDARFMVSGGITEQNLADYLALPNVSAAGCSWLIVENADEIRARAWRAQSIANRFAVREEKTDDRL